MKIKFFREIENQEKITIEQIIKIILKKRKITDLKEFINPSPPNTINLLNLDKKLKKQIKIILNVLKEIKQKNQMIVVYTDYDADGITGGAIVWETLYLLGFKVMPYVPHRIKEGYGFSVKGIDNVIKEFNPVLLISVDHGITKIKEIEYAKKKGLKVFITDHHLKADKIPKADAIFHIPVLSGSGVAYFFAKEIFERFKPMIIHSKTYELLERNFQNDYLAFASIGTIADLVPLIGPSRSIVKFGLETLSKINRYGIKHILKQAGILDKKITPYDIGFIIAPRINAVGRLKHALDALRLLCTVNNQRAYELAKQVGTLNVQRQDLVEKSVEEAKKVVKKNNLDNNKLIVLISDKWHEGIIGLIAAKITEEFYRPTIVLTKTDDHFKGSARSIPNFHITNFLKSLKSYLVDVGGHSQAAGFTIKENQLKNFCVAAQGLADELIKDKDVEKIIEVDLKIPISKISLELVKNLETLSPFGVGNPQPTFYSEAILTDAKLFGKNNEHLKIIVSDYDHQFSSKNLSEKLISSSVIKKTVNHYLELIAFNQGNKFPTLSRGQKINLVYTLEVNRWGGIEKVRGRIETILL